jgi:hypothetical protein
VTPFSHEPQRINSRRQRSGGSTFLVHTQINVSTPEEVCFPLSKDKRVFFSAAAEQQQTAAATARPVAARWKHKYKQLIRGRRGKTKGFTTERR